MGKKYILALVSLFVMVVNASSEDLQVDRIKYAEVLKHYSRQSSDSLKFRAALFLIDNIGLHFTVQSKSLDCYYSKLANIECVYNYPECKEHIYALADSIVPDISYERISDNKVISSQYLIDNIDDAFDKWQKGSFSQHLNFAEFCEYLLPYKLTNERVENWRTELYAQYKRGLESIVPVDDKKYSAYWGATQVNDIIKQDKIHIQNVPYIGNVNLPISVLKNLKMGMCNDYAFKTAYVMRACGIPVCVDFTPQWPTRPHSHHWNVVLDNSGKNIPFMGAESNPGYPCKDDYVVGKIYRYQYALQKQSLFWKNKMVGENVPENLNSPFIKDVTEEYTKGVTVTLNLKGKNIDKKHFAYLAAFDNQEWIPIAFAEIKDDKAVFENVGRGAVYLPVLWNERCIPVECPIKVKENGEIVLMKPMVQNRNTINLTRKYPTFSRIYSYSKRMNKGVFVASNTTSFDKKVIVAEIDRNPEMQMDSVFANYKYGQFRYLRYMAPKRSHCNVAELYFYDCNKKQIFPNSVTTDGTEDKGFNGTEVLDGKFLTFYESKKTDHAYLDFDFGKEVKLSMIKYLPRNDDNYVTPGHKYRLDYYDREGPQPLLTVIANSSFVTFKNVPSGALLILHDLTGGTEERIFEYEDGNIIWH